MNKVVLFLSTCLFVSIPAQILLAAPPPLPDHLVLYFRFDQDGVNTISDLSGHKNDGKIDGQAQWQDSQYGKALVLDGSVVTVNVDPSDDLTNLEAPMSIGVVFKPITLPADWHKMLGMYGSANGRDNGWALEFQNDQFNFVIFNSKNHWGVTLKEGVWVYLVSVLDEKTVTYYVDGKKVAETDAGPQPTDVKNSPGMWIGAEAGTIGNQPVDMLIDELWISNKAIDNNEVTALSPDVLMAVTSQGKLATTWGKIKYGENLGQ